MEDPSDLDFSRFSPESGTNLAHNVDNDIFLQMVYISPGSFRMGVPVYVHQYGFNFIDDLKAYIHRIFDIGKIALSYLDSAMPGVPVDRQNDSAEIQPTVVIRKFYMSKSPITPAQYISVMGDSDGIDCKLLVALVGWFQARTFCQKLSDRTQRQYRLTSEVEWGYACLLANEFGLRDIYRDNWEWCDQSRGEDLTAEIEIEKNLDGAWYVSPDLSSGIDRNAVSPSNRYFSLGFRVVLADGY